MTEDQAIYQTDTLIKLLIQHQPTLMPQGLTHTQNSAVTFGTALATLRATLIAELKKQPERE